VSKQVVLTNGATLYSDGASNALSGTITLYGTNTIQVNQPLAYSAYAGTADSRKPAPGHCICRRPTPIRAPHLLMPAASSWVRAVPSPTPRSLPWRTTPCWMPACRPAVSAWALGRPCRIWCRHGQRFGGTGARIAPGTAAAGTLTFNNTLTLNGGPMSSSSAATPSPSAAGSTTSLMSPAL